MPNALQKETRPLNPRTLLSALGALASLSVAAPALAQNPPVRTVVLFPGATPIGVTVSRAGRIFMLFPRAFDAGPYVVAEIKNGVPIPYPNAAVNRLSRAPQAQRLVSVQGLTADASDHLWLLDLGVIKTQPTSYGGPKLICVDLKTNKITQTIVFSRTVAGPNAYLNDVRVDLRLGKAGTAFITDSSEKGPNGIVVVDLATGTSRRRLNDDPSVKAEPGFTPVVEGQPLLKHLPGMPPQKDRTGADGLTLTPDGKYLYYCPNEGRHLYRVSAAALANPAQTDAQVAATVENLGDKGFATDGMEADASGYICLTDYEHNAIKRRSPTGEYETIVSGPSYIWPDSIAFGPDGSMYFDADQLNRQAKFQNRNDLRKKPIPLYRVSVGSQPVMLR